MKKAFALILPLVGIACAALSFINLPNPMVGRWQQKLRNGRLVMANFRTDDTYDISVNGKFLFGGKYYVKNDTAGISDPLCNANYYGTYTISFFAPDSVRWNVVQDTCGGRRRSYDNHTLGRLATGAANATKP